MVYEKKQDKTNYLMLAKSPVPGAESTYMSETLFFIELTMFESEGRLRESSVIKIKHKRTATYLSSAEVEQELNRRLLTMNSS